MKKNAWFIFLFCFLICCSFQKTEWHGTIEVVDGVTVVKNPIEPMYGEEIFTIEEELSIGVAAGAEEYMFQNAWEVVVDNNERIFVSDRRAFHIKVFDKFGKYVKTIGRKGQGPGEFSQISSIQITPRNELMIYERMGFKLTFFSLDGDYIRTVLLKGIQAFWVRENSKGNYFESSVEFQGQYNTNTFRVATEVKEYGSDFAFIKTIAKDKFRNANVPLRHDMLARFQSFDLLICGYKDSYELHFINLEGEIVRKVLKDYSPIEISEEEKIKRTLPESRERPKHFPAFQDFSVDEEGRIYVQLFERQMDDDKFYYDVFDPESRYIARIRLNALPKYWKNGKMYTIEADDEGFQVVKRYKVNWNY
jgi:hypothetical protein